MQQGNKDRPFLLPTIRAVTQMPIITRTFVTVHLFPRHFKPVFIDNTPFPIKLLKRSRF